MMMMNEKLKPCPFCGGEAEVVRISSNSFFVRCKECTTFRPISESEEEAIKLWNERADCWIPVEERLPEYDLPCLVSTKNDGDPLSATGIAIAFYDPECEEWEGVKYGKVTAWMPLPNPYEKGEN